MPRKSRSPVAILLICALIAALASLAEGMGWFDLFELKTVDARFRARYWAAEKTGRIKVSEEVVLAAIDQKSADPAYSDFSDRWGMGGWLTRDHWTRAVYNLASFYKPGVVAYDILFMPYRSGGRRVTTPGEGMGFIEESIRKKAAFRDLTLDERFPRLEVLELVDASGNAAFAESFNNVDDARADGQEVPDFLAAYYFTRSGVESAPAWKLSTADDAEKLKFLKGRSIPSQFVTGVPDHFPYLDNVEMPFDALAGAALHFGFINVDRDRDGNIRRIPLVHGFLDPADGKPVFVPSLALQSCLLHLGIDLGALRSDASGDLRAGIRVKFGEAIEIGSEKQLIRIPVDDHGRMFLNFTGKVNDFQPVSYADLNRCGPFDTAGKRRDDLSKQDLAVGDTIRKHIAGKILVIGVTFTGATDVGPCAIDSNAPFSLIHLTAIDNILRSHFLGPFSRVGNMAVIWALLLVIGLLNASSHARASVAGTTTLVGGYLLLCLALFGLNVACLPMVLPFLSMLVGFGGISLYRYQVERKAGLEIRKRFSTMVSGDLLEQMEENPDSLALGGERRDVTVFFSDVAGFTSVAESLTPTKLVEVINSYLTPMTEIILGSRGYLNKFLGDGIMAVWGAPLPMEDHAEQACRAALAQQERIAELRPVFRDRFGVDLQVRMGLNTGSVDAGNMGSLNRFEYTVMGDSVNLGARLEPANKDYGTRIIIGGETAARIRGRGLVVRLLDRIVVQGKSEAVEIHELIGLDAGRPAQEPDFIRLFEEGLRLYWNREWEQALARFEAALKVLPEDKATKLFMQRIQEFRQTPPPVDWQGEYVREKKG